MGLCFALSEFGFLMICHEIMTEWAKTEITDPNQRFG